MDSRLTDVDTSLKKIKAFSLELLYTSSYYCTGKLNLPSNNCIVVSTLYGAKNVNIDEIVSIRRTNNTIIATSNGKFSESSVVYVGVIIVDLS